MYITVFVKFTSEMWESIILRLTLYIYMQFGDFWIVSLYSCAYRRISYTTLYVLLYYTYILLYCLLWKLNELWYGAWGWKRILLYMLLHLGGGAHARVYSPHSRRRVHVHKTPAVLNRITSYILYYIVGNIMCERGKWRAPGGYPRVKHTCAHTIFYTYTQTTTKNPFPRETRRIGYRTTPKRTIYIIYTQTSGYYYYLLCFPGNCVREQHTRCRRRVYT